MNEHTALVIAVREALKQTSMRKLAVKAGVSHTTISAIIGGKSADVSLKTYQALMNATESNMRKPVTTHDHASASFEQVEQLAAQRVNADLTHHADWDVDLQCAKYRRVMQLEKELEQSKAEVSVWRNKTEQACENAREAATISADILSNCEVDNHTLRQELDRVREVLLENQSKINGLNAKNTSLQDVLENREQHLKSCENALIEANEKIQNVLDESGKQLADLSLQLRDANAEIKRLTALSETQGQSWKAACVQVEQLQKQLDHTKETIEDLKHEVEYQRREAEKANAAFCEQSLSMMDRNVTIEALKSQSKQTKTKHDQQIMRLRVYVWSLIAALVFVLVSGLVVWGGA